MNRLNLWISLAASAGLSLWLGRFQGPVTVLGGFILLFLILRGLSFREVLTASLGAAAAAFVLPVSLLGAMAAFALVQVIAELRLSAKGRHR
ncbi:MAG TPA: hypothetical protein VFX30_01405, partial [bacterium]|nr:hypothetical protein [bacterium]